MPTTTTAPPVTRTGVHDLTRRIRRSTKEVDQTVDAMHHVATERMGMPSLQTFVDAPDSVSGYSKDRLRDLLGDVEGCAALLREMLDAD